ncbi:MAG TPA: S41 family peptidase, partial [Planctomycetota bacterium]|nr:S41 family peptidase [Planctomycetota bacterium]
MLGPLLASVLVLLPAQSGELTARLDETLDRLEQSQGTATWDLARELRDAAETDSALAAPYLVATAPSRPAAVQVVIASTLVELDDGADAADLLLPLVEGEQGSAALAVLADRGFRHVDAVAERLNALLDQPLPAERRLEVARTLHAVGNHKSQARARTLLLDALQSDDAETRVQAALKLGEIGMYPEARAVLKTLRDDPGPRGQLARAYLATDETLQNYSEKLYRRSEQVTAAPVEESREPLASGKGHLDVLEELIRRVQEHHLLGEQLQGDDGRERLITAAARGMLAALDPHSTYFTNKEFERWILELRRNYAGIGAYVDTIDGVFTITRPIYSGPAAAAGLLSGDRILKVDGWDTHGQSNDDIIRRLKGEPETEVTISVHRDGWTELKQYTLVRKAIHIDSVHWDMLPGGVGYAEVVGFAEDTTKELRRALTELSGQGMQGFILDLRNNSGGYLEEAVRISSLFLQPQQLVVYTEGRGVERHNYKAEDTRGARWDGPLVVLVNERSASASEIVAGALQDTARAQVVGEKTFGKGSVQQAMAMQTRPGDGFTDENRNGAYDPGEPFDDDDGDGVYTFPVSVKITNARYYLPSGRSIHTELDLEGRVIQDGGVTPDVEVAFDGLEPWENAEIARMYDRLTGAVPEGQTFKDPFDAYVDSHFDEHKELFTALADGDGRDVSRYPDFAELRAGLGAEHVPDDTIRMLLRQRIRDRVADDRRKSFPGGFVFGDWQEDVQLQAAIREIAQETKLDLATLPAYR